MARIQVMNAGSLCPKDRTIVEIPGIKRKEALREEFERLRAEYQNKVDFRYFDGFDSYHFRAERGVDILVFELIN